MVPRKEKLRKEAGDGDGVDNVSRTIPAEENLEHFRAGKFTNDACCR